MTAKSSEGTKCLDRTVELLRALSGHRTIGWRVTDLAVHCDMKVCIQRVHASPDRSRLGDDRRFLQTQALFSPIATRARN